MRRYPIPTKYTLIIRLHSESGEQRELVYTGDTLPQANLKLLDSIDEAAFQISGYDADFIEFTTPNFLGCYSTASGSALRITDFEGAKRAILQCLSIFWDLRVRPGIRRISDLDPGMEDWDEDNLEKATRSLGRKFAECERLLVEFSDQWVREQKKKLRREWVSDRAQAREEKRFAKARDKAIRKGQIPADSRLHPDADPLDPHGDGTLREGDAVFDAVMKGQVVSGTRNSDGWTLDTHDPDDKVE